MVLVVAVVLAGAPMATLHAHEGGSRDHSHDAVASAVAHHDQDHHSLAPDEQVHQGDDPAPTGTLSVDAVLHLHDAGTLVSTMTSFSALALPELKPATLDSEPSTPSPPTAARTPLHRPPIA